ncbi:MAG TPA: hypothetical protein VG844_07935 [Terracidiphilus sp.]|nr:hypothetical protein [Terracidiphilus sp.]
MSTVQALYEVPGSLADDLREQIYVELWVSLASLLRSYTAAHGLNKDRQATVELGEERITVRHGDSWLDLKRDGSTVRWSREDGSKGELELTEAGTLKTNASDEAMDLVAEAWARELMR